MEEKLVNKCLSEYLSLLSDGIPAPGGGAAAALSGAQGAALVMMVANFTIGKEKYKEYEELNRQTVAKADILLEAFRAGVDADKDAYLEFSEVFKLPKESEPEKQFRKQALAKASETAARAPLNMMEKGVECLRLAAALKGKSNKSLESDIFVAAHLLEACVTGSKYNVDANIPYIAEESAKELKEKAETLQNEALRITGEILGVPAEGQAKK
jgi:formiminotetrahydrofolate cyclodeaminase